jgi:hypothetical protein
MHRSSPGMLNSPRYVRRPGDNRSRETVLLRHHPSPPVSYVGVVGPFRGLPNHCDNGRLGENRFVN